MSTLKSKKKAIQTFNVPCRVGCDGTRCLCSVVEFRRMDEAQDGTRGLRVYDRRIPGSVTILSGQTLEVPDFVLLAPEVKRALASGDLRLL